MDSQLGDAGELSKVSDDELLRGLSAVATELSQRPHLLHGNIHLLQEILPSQYQSATSSIRTNTPSSQGLSSGSSFLSSSSTNAHGDTSQSPSAILDRRLADPTSTSLRTRRRPKPIYTCTLCLETGIANRTFKEKADWKKHMSNFHETGKEWLCSVTGCTKSFARERDYVQHHNKHHRGTKSSCNTRNLPVKLVHPCGFSGCRVMTSSWVDWCDHVAKCSQSDKGWEYSNRIRTLLKQNTIRKIWKAARNQVCNQYRIAHRELIWHPETSRSILERLQCEKLSSLSTGLFVEIARLGLPQALRVNPHGVTTEQIFSFPMNMLDASAIPPSSSYHDRRKPLPPTMSSWDHQTPSMNGPFPETADMAVSLTSAQNRYSVAMPDAPLEFGDVEEEGPVNLGSSNFSHDDGTSNAFPELFDPPDPPDLLHRPFELIEHSLEDPHTDSGATNSTSPTSTFGVRETSWLDVPFESGPTPRRRLPLNFARPFLPLQ
ncbi:hypothetical protein BDV96DRAFT_580003 [Lophiotrema nucula]|uniref:C2H2-type domain-containing protein n=1 Tax=Lophiotrema nucula TaxID=690887 RepID=A0A6A5YZN1_9PLEO|nr:hypothetical protein BDV96DRAFT_580003 [Lophiotrema nucula]